MKPSPYFADTFAFFFKRFLSKESLLRWFCKKAGDESKTFQYPIPFANIQGIFVILPEAKDALLAYLPFLKNLEKFKNHGTLLLAHRDHQKLLQEHRIAQEIFYYTTNGCRYGESEFQKLQTILPPKKISISICLEPEPRFQMLFLAKMCGAAYRFGFDCEKFYPLLNLSLSAGDEHPKRSEFLMDLFNRAVP